jgi:hypothetical protein
LAQVLREQGVRGLWFGALAGANVYRRLELVELDLQRPPPAAPAAPTLDFGFLGADELDAYLALEVPGSTDGPSDRLRRGDRCFVARDGGEIVSSRWIASRRAHVAYLGRWLDLEPDDTYLYETFTHPSRRGRSVSAAAGTRLAAALAAEGRRRILAGVLRENHAGTRAYEKAGYRRIGCIGYVKLGPWRRDFQRMRHAVTGP